MTNASPIASAVSGALRALALTLPAALAGTGVALAQSAAPAPAAPAALSADIPAQPLAAALASFAQQTGLQVVYVSGLIRDQQSHPVMAGSNAQEALAHLLQGTGLRFDFLTVA